MSLEKDITGIKHRLDEDVFKSATDDDLENRKTAAQKEAEKQAKVARVERERKEKEWEEKNNRKIDTCPHCGVDFRDCGARYDPVYGLETSYGTQGRYWEDGGGFWDWGNGDTNSSEIDGWKCSACDGDLVEGEDFDVNL